MSALSLAAHDRAQVLPDVFVRCPLCSAEAPEPLDGTLHDCVLLESDRTPQGVLYGRDRNGWFVVSVDGDGVAYCPAHSPRKCLRHAAAHLHVELPEGVR